MKKSNLIINIQNIVNFDLMGSSRSFPRNNVHSRSYWWNIRDERPHSSKHLLTEIWGGVSIPDLSCIRFLCSDTQILSIAANDKYCYPRMLLVKLSPVWMLLSTITYLNDTNVRTNVVLAMLAVTPWPGPAHHRYSPPNTIFDNYSFQFFSSYVVRERNFNILHIGCCGFCGCCGCCACFCGYWGCVDVVASMWKERVL